MRAASAASAGSTDDGGCEGPGSGLPGTRGRIGSGSFGAGAQALLVGAPAARRERARVRPAAHLPGVDRRVLASLALLWICDQRHVPYVGFLTTAVLLLVLALELRRPEARQRVEDIAVTCFGVLYVGWLSAHLVLLRELPWSAGTSYRDGAAYVLLAFFVTWSCDTGAFAIGRLFGRNRPWTRISPRKSLEGSVGGLAFAMIASVVARLWFAPFLRWVDALVIGVLVGVFAQVGDLVESLLKRDARHGDSSDLIPGHGGVLDRFDSLFFAAPVVYYYLAHVVFGVPR
ncbi:MAG: phosphatidate cytidylyltransferase [Candidatus Eisenbacteria bacterium]|uniref:Phosphatidate cytidylyltransferase n=1 Tax=Eiseniibacteriota bacterium TaxID=2212470 RepID=A0A538U8B5_UNCEI|nr:MAG: phosphatidate cytidylyltransferase [Candidatus Eisenbacteria bacterium]